ncbi:MAG: C1 family peptidase, partial [Planctomycetota bacterium]
CGSCVAFGVAAALESRWAVQNGGTLLPSGEEIDLSEAHLFYCYGKTAGRNCGNGWWPAAPLEKVRDEGVVPEACFPYTPGNQDCVVCSGPGFKKWKITGYERVTDPASMKSWLTEKGALVTAFSVYNNFKSFFASEPNGVYRETRWPRVGGHCVCCVGFDDNQACWIIKNSWGPFFGDQGFFRIGYGVAGIDFEMFGALEVSEP